MSPPQAAGIALLAFGVTEFTLRRGETAKSLKTTAADRGTTPLILASYLAVVILLFLPRLPGALLPAWMTWMGVVLAFAGLLFRWWAMTVLGRYYTRTLTTTQDQTVVTASPYRWIRHPGYLGSLVTWLGAAAASGNLVVVALIAAILLRAYARRISAEEVMLTQSLGAAYEEYRQRTWRLVPFVY